MSGKLDAQGLAASLNSAAAPQVSALDRFKAEVDFAARLANTRPDKTEEWGRLLQQAVSLVAEGVKAGKSAEGLVAEAETLLAPLGAAAKEYTIFCCGHAHIDMNWMWTWPETVSVTYDTFSTMDKLMDEFPEFHFSQSQASVYELTRKYAPELFEKIKQRVQAGLWDVTASQWVEGDKNLASGEILCRHLLYTRRWFFEHMGIPYDQIKLDWECDTFGHCWTLPGILSRGGVTRYYHHRASGPRLRGMSSGELSQVYWWEGKDGSRVLTFDDSPNGYNNEITPRMAHLLLDLERNTGLRCMLWVYGVGDHGGGPTRRHLRAARDMATWPIFPCVKLSTTDDFYTEAERQIAERNLQIPVYKDELNFVFEGCYTSESCIKFANRKGENDLFDTEFAALLAERACGAAYPQEQLNKCWERAMFLQFHDILPGSGVRETVHHAMGLFQENLANTGIIRTRSLRSLADKMDTSALAPARPGSDQGLGGGAGNDAWWGGVSTLGAGQSGSDPFVVYNPAAFERDELVRLKIWDRELPGRVVVRDSAGNLTAGQIVDKGNYWGHSFVTVAFVARRLPALGWRAYTVEAGEAPADGEGAYIRETGRPIYGLGYVNAQLTNPVVMGNEFLEMTISAKEGGIIELTDKVSGIGIAQSMLPLGALLRQQEAPHGMTAWQLGAIVEEVEPLADGTLRVVQNGPNLAAVQLSGKHKDSDYRLTISLARGSRQISFDLDVNWLERGEPQTGVPVLRACFPVNVTEGKATFEIACGSIERRADGEEAPALNWADVTGMSWEDVDQEIGVTVLNDSKYGHRVSEDTVQLTLLRSSYDPDPLPEIGRHQIRYAVVPHMSALDVPEATRQGFAFNHPVITVGTTVHEGDLAAEMEGLSVLTPKVMLSGVKKAEDGTGLILRLYEMTGEATSAQVRIAPWLAAAGSPAVETDLLERALPESTAKMDGDVLTVTIPAYGITTVRIG